MILWQLYASFFIVGVFCVGGGYASIPLIQAQVINLHHWMNMHEFMNVFAMSQTIPGAIGINVATFVGTNVGKIPGAIAATLGFVTPSFFIMIGLAKLFQKYGELPALRGVLNGLRPAVMALISSAGVMFFTLALFGSEKFPRSLHGLNYIGAAILILAFIIIKQKLLGVIQTIIISGILGLVLNMFLH